MAFLWGQWEGGVENPERPNGAGGRRDEVEGWESRVMICIWGRGVS